MNLLHIKRNACNGVKLGRTVTFSECREVMRLHVVFCQMGEEVNRLEERTIFTA
jgi:hypothetical protein